MTSLLVLRWPLCHPGNLKNVWEMTTAPFSQALSFTCFHFGWTLSDTFRFHPPFLFLFMCALCANACPSGTSHIFKIVWCVFSGSMSGMRPAEAGEFTRRAFQAGKLDLTEVAWGVKKNTMNKRGVLYILIILVYNMHDVNGWNECFLFFWGINGHSITWMAVLF